MEAVSSQAYPQPSIASSSLQGAALPPMVLSVVTLGSVSHLLMKCNARPTSKSASSRAPTTNRAISQLWREAGGVKAEMGCCSQDPAQHGVPRGGRLQPPSHSSSTCLQTPCGTLALAGFKQPALGLLEWGYPRPTGRCRHPDFQGHQDGKVTALSPLTVKQPAIVTPLPITHQCQKTALCKQQHQMCEPSPAGDPHAQLCSHSQLLCDDTGVLLWAIHSGLVSNSLPSTEKRWGLARRSLRQLSTGCCCSGSGTCIRPEIFTTESTHVRFSSAEKHRHALSRGEPTCCMGTPCSCSRNHLLPPCSLHHLL